MDRQVEEYVRDATRWKKELTALRAILAGCGLTEEFKWRGPCYTHEGKNIASLGELKAGASLGFFKGVLLNDPQGLLEKPGANSRVVKRLVVTSLREVKDLESAVKAFVHQALELERTGQEVDLAADPKLALPVELKEEFLAHPELKKAFEALTPGRQRGYLLHFRGASQPATRTARVKKYSARILDGHGLHDCVCGHTARPPRCDGSHKNH